MVGGILNAFDHLGPWWVAGEESYVFLRRFNRCTNAPPIARLQGEGVNLLLYPLAQSKWEPTLPIVLILFVNLRHPILRHLPYLNTLARGFQFYSKSPLNTFNHKH